tara:strand:- start:18 stop:623 length:606 start_codon:yes stop_codon:yes gene_type:complete
MTKAMTYVTQDVTYQFQIQGKDPGIMFNNPAMMAVDTSSMSKGKKTYDADEEAEMRTYRNDDGNLCVPSTQVRASILEASKVFKVGRSSAKTILNHIIVEPFDLIELKDKKDRTIIDYEQDQRRVVVQRSGIIRTRPVVKDWQLSFSIIADAEIMNATWKEPVDALIKIVSDAGKKQGIGDYRPQKGGNFGRFDVIDIKEL